MTLGNGHLFQLLQEQDEKQADGTFQANNRYRNSSFQRR